MLILKTIKLYQKFISPFLGRNCRFYPSCSEYSYQIIKKHGVLKGGMLSFWRVLKCNPWNRGGVDLL
ncbi:membrane protein insertion efficiency factor YidD [bacterium (Candidatus Gribaldobacteria) CG_4_9_14_3_um_filter_36_15]|uniref:Putative membrane protein insertion efficiency factor n=3 Tax=Candidatus Gribaldobacteria TaxID=2798536 RepID=A0A2M7VK28_9BACT|nr:MAG: membrane protein insertion efficiency factor YidD [Parcubacteria group bacterium CG2_30_36_21]PIV14239.1 MAG: membrane protein insertion efficiency factor YidD [bacterium (Candidatus Gribaldobacteria) CG03_land_8_20_14_0_80_36_40]PJA02197.1 MAG: membrane protein insertion efficiency factor YidD [bacterium (Candidatus Gribaldobacteria) CG_4_10_14_0_2_um_filter_36_18]PJB09329.1 MAG: membrane protein insertion efficiency factor YidD [bacterium (Candidatus Gribaldobacteria) CG_4_9_14_3_um_fi